MPKNENVKSYYNQVADEYNKSFYVKTGEYPPLKFRHKHILEMLAEEKLPEQCAALDIGCGPGEMVRDLAIKGWNVQGIDISEEMIKIARGKNAALTSGKGTVELQVGDIENLKFADNTFDVVVCAGVVEYLRDDEKWSQELGRVLKPGGILILNVTNKYAVRRWTMFAVDFLKSLPFAFSIMNFIKEKLLKKGKLNQFPFKPRTHGPADFDRFLHKKGFEKTGQAYFDFSIFPAPIDTLLDFFLLPIRKKMEDRPSRNMFWSGNGYIVKARKRH